jgi:hypothetical protein
VACRVHHLERPRGSYHAGASSSPCHSPAPLPPPTPLFVLCTLTMVFHVACEWHVLLPRRHIPIPRRWLDAACGDAFRVTYWPLLHIPATSPLPPCWETQYIIDNSEVYPSQIMVFICSFVLDESQRVCTVVFLAEDARVIRLNRSTCRSL